MNRRRFITMLTGLLGALGARIVARTKKREGYATVPWKSVTTSEITDFDGTIERVEKT